MTTATPSTNASATATATASTTATSTAMPTATPTGLPAAPFVWLASQSPRRQALLEQIGLRFALLLAGPDEDAEALEAVCVGESPTQYVERVVLAKAQAAQAEHAVRLAAARTELAAAEKKQAEESSAKLAGTEGVFGSPGGLV